MSTSSSEHNPHAPLGRWMLVFAWILVLGLFTWFFTRWLEHQQNPNANPFMVQTADGVQELVLQRNRAGHYLATGTVNNYPVLFLLDTGATNVALSESLAQTLRLVKGSTHWVSTANGEIKVHATRLDLVGLGGILRRNVKANILPNMHQNEVLLGMSFLKHLELIQRGDKLIVRQYSDSSANQGGF